MNPNTAPLVRINWADIVEVSAWNEEEECDPATVTSIGYLIEDRPQWYRIARDYHWEDERWAGVVTIPKVPPEIEVLKPDEAWRGGAVPRDLGPEERVPGGDDGGVMIT